MKKIENRSKICSILLGVFAMLFVIGVILGTLTSAEWLAFLFIGAGVGILAWYLYEYVTWTSDIHSRFNEVAARFTDLKRAADDVLKTMNEKYGKNQEKD